jgi:hypothetical protein
MYFYLYSTTVSVRKFEGKRRLGKPMYTGENSNKLDLKYNEHGDVEVDSFDSGHSIVVGLCEFSNEASHPTTEKKFLDYPSISYSRSTLLYY